MAEKVLLLDKSVERRIKIADRLADNEDFLGALGFLFSAEQEAQSYEIYMRIADIYAETGLLDLSNRYWFKYMFAAPKDKVSVAYEELAVNYFYMDNLWAAGYYFHKKLSADGYISKEELDKEVVDFFSGEDFKKHAYRVVYPYEIADYSVEIKNGKRAIALGGFADAVKILSKIPSECRDEEVSSDLAVAYFMSDKLDEAEEVCRDSLARHGETVTAYCNLSTVYDMKKDFDNSEFYYRKALSVADDKSGNAYKIATCAIEREDHEKAKDCLEKILEERPFELSMRFFYGIALINIGDYEGAVQAFKLVRRTDINDAITEYYLDLAMKLSEGDSEAEKILPLKYVKELPKSVALKWSRKIRNLVKLPEKIALAMKKPENRKIAEWGMRWGTDSVMRASAFLVSSADAKYFLQTAKKMVIDSECRDGVKKILLYLLIIKGVKSKIGVTIGCCYIEFSPKKLLCEKDPDGAIYLSAYALCVSKMIFYDVDDLRIIGAVTDKAYKKFKGVLSDSDVTNEELAAFIISECGYGAYSGEQWILNSFEISSHKLKTLKEIYDTKEEKRTKNDKDD